MATYRENMFRSQPRERGQAHVRAQADELPRPHPDLQARPANATATCRSGSPNSARCTATSRRARCTASCACAPSPRTTRISSARSSRSPRKCLQGQRSDPVDLSGLRLRRLAVKFSDRPEKRVGDDAVWDHAEAALKALRSPAGHDDCNQPGRGRVLRPEARICAARRHRPRLAVRHHPGRLQHAGAARRLLHRRALDKDAGDAAPRDVRLVRALHRHPDRALCRASPALAVAGAGGGRHHHLGRRRLRARGDRGGAPLGLRVEGDLRNEKINYKVREHSLAKVPVLLVVGKKEAAERTSRSAALAARASRR